MIVKPFEIDTSKVKRFFAFGCSFTNFFWPTWANIIGKELEHAEYHNFGGSGLGNLAITAKVGEANYRLNFCETDLVMILWSTFVREDRWLNGRWFGAGNVYSNGMYDKNFTDKYSDVCGYLVRDGALIALTKELLQSLPCQVMLMPSVPIKHMESTVRYNQENYEQIIDLYKPLFDDMPKSLFDHLNINGFWPDGHTYYWSDMGMHHDQHPIPTRYFDYLNKNIIHLSDRTKDYAETVTKKLLSLGTKDEICKAFEHKTRERLLF